MFCAIHSISYDISNTFSVFRQKNTVTVLAVTFLECAVILFVNVFFCTSH